MGQHAAFIGQQRAAECTHCLAGGNVFLVHGVRLGQKLFLDLSEGCARGQQRREKPLHAVDGPKQIHRGGARSSQPRADALELRRELLRRDGFGAQCAESDAVSRRDADGRRAADDHRDNHVGHLLVGGGEHVALLQGEPGLVDEANAFRRPG